MYAARTFGLAVMETAKFHDLVSFERNHLSDNPAKQNQFAQCFYRFILRLGSMQQQQQQQHQQ
jgi:hypothetical protein